MKIKIWESDQGGWMFNIWLDEEADEDEDPCDDGGLCTGNRNEQSSHDGTEQETLEFATAVAQDLLGNKKRLSKTTQKA